MNISHCVHMCRWYLCRCSSISDIVVFWGKCFDTWGFMCCKGHPMHIFNIYSRFCCKMVSQEHMICMNRCQSGSHVALLDIVSTGCLPCWSMGCSMDMIYKSSLLSGRLLFFKDKAGMYVFTCRKVACLGGNLCICWYQSRQQMFLMDRWSIAFFIYHILAYPKDKKYILWNHLYLQVSWRGITCIILHTYHNVASGVDSLSIG